MTLEGAGLEGADDVVDDGAELDSPCENADGTWS